MSDIKTAIEAFEAIVKAADHAMYYPELEKLANIVRPILFDAQKVRDEAFEQAAYLIENGNFIHDSAPDAIIAKQAAKAIRKLKSSPAQPVADRHEAALQALADDAQAHDMGYGENACRTCGKSQPTTLKAPQDDHSGYGFTHVNSGNV